MEYVAESISEFIQGAIGVSAKEMFIQIASTLLLFLVIRFFFWNNITDYLDKRKNAMANEFEEAKQANSEAQTLKISASEELNEVRLSAKGIVDDAKNRGEAERSDIITKAKSEATQVMQNAQKEIESEVIKARESIKEEIATVAILIAEKVIKKEIDKQQQNDIIKQITNEVAS